jgi:hypothetical protein
VVVTQSLGQCLTGNDLVKHVAKGRTIYHHGLNAKPNNAPGKNIHHVQ